MRDELTEAEKGYIYHRKLAGARLKEIAQEVGCAYETARKWWRYQRDGRIPQRRGRPARGALSTFPAEIVQALVKYKEQHPHQGPEMARLAVAQQLEVPLETLPSASRLAVAFQEQCPAAVTNYRGQQYPEQAPSSGQVAHDIWQMDAKEKVCFGDNEVATVLNVRDPYSALMIRSDAYLTTTRRGWRKLTYWEVQSTLRAAFARHGLPQAVQTDREVVYIGAPERYFPSLFTLWLAGLGVVHVVIRSHRPTDQGAVERCHRTLGGWTWKDTHYDSLAALQVALETANQMYNRHYPARTRHCHRQPPLVVHPHACHSGRHFHPALEWDFFDMQLVDAYLARQVWRRRANDTGTVSVNSFPYHLGRPNRSQTLAVTFDADTRSFCFTTKDGTLIAQRPARGLEKADLIGYAPADPHWPRLDQPAQLPLKLKGV